MRSKRHDFLYPNIYRQQKYPVRYVSENKGYIKKVSFWKIIGCQKIYSAQIFRVNTVIFILIFF